MAWRARTVSAVQRGLPGVGVLRKYRRSWLRADLVAGLTVGAMLIPQSMGYAELAGVPPHFGFYAVIGALVVYALVGSSRHLGVGPEPGTAVLAASGVGAIAGADGERYLVLIAALALVVGALCVVGWALRLGYLASVLSKPVLVGYISGVGVTLLSSQIAGFTGLKITADSFVPRVRQFLSQLNQVNRWTMALALGTLAVMLLLKRGYPAVPAALVGVVGATLVTAVGSLEGRGIALIGAIPSGIPTPAVPSVSTHDLVALLPVAVGIALVGFTDNVLTARAISIGRDYRVDPNQELLALGLVNVTSGLSQGFPISSSASRTAVPASLGSRTQLVSLIASGFVVIALLAGRPLLSEIPRAALAAVIVMAAITIIDFGGFVMLWRVSREESLIAAAAALGVVVLGVLPGIILAVGISLIGAIARISRPHDAVLRFAPGAEGWVDVDQYPEAHPSPGLVVFRFDAPLFFMNADRFADRVEASVSDRGLDVRWLIVDAEGIGALDASAIEMLSELLSRLRQDGLEVIGIARANDRVVDRLLRAGLVEPNGPLKNFATITAAARAFHERRL